MKNKKGEFNISLMILVAVGVIVGLIMLQASAGYVGDTSKRITRTNTTYTSPANGAYSDITDCQEILGSYTITNATGGEIIGTGNITMEERVGTDGTKTVSLKTNAANYASKSVNATYICGADGYIEDTGAAAVTNLIVLFGALAIGIFTLIPSVRDFVKDNLGF